MRTIAAIILLTFALATQASATTTTQTFTSSWSIDPWDYYGDLAAMKWHYLPYEPWNPALGVLQEVIVSTNISGTRDSLTDDLSIRYSFFTGWSPADYQLSSDLVIGAGTADFNISETFTFSSPVEIQNWEIYSFYPPANYYFESRTVSAGHTIFAETTLTYSYISAVPEPETHAMLLAGLGLLGFMLRRRKESVV